MNAVRRPIRFDGERRHALFVRDAGAAALDERARAEDDIALAYAIVPDATELVTRGWTDLGRVPALRRPLRVAGLPLVLPRTRQGGVREITVADPRITRLWDRFSIDIPVAIERNAAHVNPLIFPAGAPPTARVLVFEDGDRYVIRALCIFERGGAIRELLHDRSLAGMRAASHLLGLALRELLATEARYATALSATHSGSYPIFARHLFTALGVHTTERLVVLPRDPEVTEIVTRPDYWYVSGLDA